MNFDILLWFQTDLITKHGYPVELYANIATEDKYLLDIYRIPHGKSSLDKQTRPAVLLIHGLTSNCRDWLIGGPEKGLGFLLADRGYDVWLPNTRETTYSRKHLVLNPDVDAKFWDFSWHELGIYDLPAIITLIQNVTKKESMSYIGLSQGTTMFYVLASQKPEYNKYINVMVSLAPIAYMEHFHGGLIKFFASLEPIFTPLAQLLGINEFPPAPVASVISLVSRTLCQLDGFFRNLCEIPIFLADGYDPQEDTSLVIASFSDQRIASVRQYLHYAQNINSGKFRQFNFGRRKNIQKYGSTEPPSYDLKKITSPVALYYGNGDWFSRPEDVERLCRELSNCVYKYLVPYQQFNHLDFLAEIEVVELVYENVFEILEKYNTNFM